MTTTRDAFLDGRLHIRQPKHGYRAGADPVFLAAAVPVKPGESVLDLGCGAGVAMLCLLAREGDARVTGVERDTEAAGLARDNLVENGLSAETVCADIAALPEDIRARSFDHVMTNPPFFDRAHGSAADNAGREAGRGVDTALETWIDAGLRRLAPSGTFTLVHRVDALPRCLVALDARVGDITALPLAARRGRPAKLVILQAKKGAKGAFRLLPPMILHTGEKHEKDGESYTPEAQAILRDGAALTL